jgi:alkanesulfonate monooxygenase SsuD/methylene tetrahydromethanopterin reductase-like flavin-dependent oxidoreductase (luciferase family)
MVYLLPLYHPLRLIEEICILDQTSGGRFLLGVGGGISPVEVGFFGVDFARGVQQFTEALDVIWFGLTRDALTYDGEFYKFDGVPMAPKPMQRPHPPLWYGISRPETVSWAVANDVNVVTFLRETRPLTDAYRSEWKALGKSETELPLLGLTRHIVLADTDQAARKIAQQACRRGAGIRSCYGSSAGCRFPCKERSPTNSTYCSTAAVALPAHRPTRANILPSRPRRAASTISSATSPLVISPSARRGGRSSFSQRKSCRPLPKPD